MENPNSPNHHESSPRKRRRIAYSPVSSSSQFESEEPQIPDPEAEVTDEDLLLLGDPDLDQDGGEDELLGQDQYLDDTDFEGDLLNEESGHRDGSGLDLDVPDDELGNEDASQQEAADDDFFGFLDEETPEGDDTKDVF